MGCHGGRRDSLLDSTRSAGARNRRETRSMVECVRPCTRASCLGSTRPKRLSLCSHPVPHTHIRVRNAHPAPDHGSRVHHCGQCIMRVAVPTTTLTGAELAQTGSKSRRSLICFEAVVAMRPTVLPARVQRRNVARKRLLAKELVDAVVSLTQPDAQLGPRADPAHT